MRFRQLNQGKSSRTEVDSTPQILKRYARDPLFKCDYAAIEARFVAEVRSSNLRSTHEFLGINADAPDDS